MKTLTKQIQGLKFDWVNPDIEKNFKEEEIRVEAKLFHFDKYISSEEIIEELQKHGYAPANLSELLEYAKNRWNNTDWVVALGSSAGVRGIRSVPCLGGSGSSRRLGLGWWSGGWGGFCRFLALRNSVSETSALDPLTFESLVARVEKLESLVNPKLLS